MSKRTKSGAIAEEEKTLQIPTDLYEEILLLLPAKDLLICKCVCKDWLKLISSARFIQKHLYRSKTEEGIRILIPSYPDIIECFHYNFPNTDNISNKIHYPLGISGNIARIFGSCDGLICLVEAKFYFCLVETESCKLALFNPSTRKSVIRTVDGIDFKSTYFHWFGYHPSCGEYVLILGYYNRRDHVTKVEVYKFSSNIKPLLHCSVCHHRLVFCLENIAVLLHGNLHWPAVCYNVGNGPCSVILKYNLHKDETNEIPVPRPFYNFSVGVIHGCLFAMLHKTNELWIMKEYGVEQSWTKYTNIEGYDNWEILSPVGFCSNEDLILGNVTLDSFSRLLTKYNFRDGEVTLLKDYYEAAIHGSKPIVFVDSLVSPELIWGTE